MAFCPDALVGGQEEAGLLLVGTEGGQLLWCQVRGGGCAGMVAC
jgi:hypothetical protein